jgi:GNAT superfamily N-acetyltransferase
MPPAVRILGAADLGEVVALQEAVTGGLHEGYVRKMAEADLRAFLDGTAGRAYGVGAAGSLECFAMLRIPSKARPNPSVGPPFPIVPPEDWPLHAAFVANTLVLPASRGRGYQRALLERRIADAEAAGMGWLCGGAHLSNVVSWRNLLARGFVIGGVRVDIGLPAIGLVFGYGARSIATDPGDALYVPLGDVAAHQDAFAKGRVGVRVDPDGTIAYQRRIAR